MTDKKTPKTADLTEAELDKVAGGLLGDDIGAYVKKDGSLKEGLSTDTKVRK